MKMLLKMFVCFVIGAGFGRFTATEWSKWHKEETCDWKQIEAPKRLITADDIRILYWEAKKRCR